MNVEQILAITSFLGDDMTQEQSENLMDEVRQLSIADRERVLHSVDIGGLYTEMSMHDGEMGGLWRY